MVLNILLGASKYLSTNLLEVAQVGNNAFIEAEVGMNQICISSLHIGGSGGTVRSMLIGIIGV